MDFGYYRYIPFFLTTFLIFHDACSRYIAPLAMIGGMVKKNCSDPQDDGEFCWSDELKANFIGAHFYGHALQMIPAYLAVRVGFNGSLRFSTLLCGVIQLTVPLTVRYSAPLSVVLQGVKGFAAGLFMAGNLDCARKWALGDEGKLVISLCGMMLFLGSGTGPFMAGLLTERINWTFPFYISGAIFTLLFLMQCVFVPDDPTTAWLMSAREKSQFETKQQSEQIAKTGDQAARYKVSLTSILRRPYLYCLTIYQVANLWVFFPEFTSVPFYFNEFLGLDTDVLSYLSLGLSLTSAISVAVWKCSLTFLDNKFSWLKCRVSMLIVPLIVRSVNLAILPLTSNVAVSIVLLVVNNIMVATAFAGGLVTVTYELDPFNGPVVKSILNGVGQCPGFLVPLIEAAITHVDQNEVGYWEEYARRWKLFFVMCGGVGLVGAMSVVVGVLGWRDEWKRHPSLIVEDTEDMDKGKKLGGGINEYVFLKDKENASIESGISNGEQ